MRIVPGPTPARAWLFRYEREADVVERGGPRLLPVPYHPTRGRAPLAAAYSDAVSARLAGEGRRAVQADVPRLAKPLVSTPAHVGTLQGALRRERYDELLASSSS